ncbi:MAG TPA: hypothetical protein VGL11_22345 [Candidatus Binatia bacterium]|jgi:hypothetical protein
MAKIWLIQEGIPLKGPPMAERPLHWCVDELGLRRGYRLATPRETLIIGRTSASDRSPFSNRQYVVVELEEEETTAHSSEGWRSAYYLVLISAEGLMNKLATAIQNQAAIH